MLTSDPNSFLNCSLICFLIASTSIPFAFFLSWFFNEQHCSTSLKIKSNSTSELNWAIFYCFWKQPAGCKVLCHSDWNCFLVLRDFWMKLFAPDCKCHWYGAKQSRETLQLSQFHSEQLPDRLTTKRQQWHQPQWCVVFIFHIYF